jgi:NAD(P)-dependent dehydrogenase (short-subunit alcohol dehydrogenase family)
MELNGKTAIVTGGSGSVGRAVVLRLVTDGAAVVIADRVAPRQADLDALGEAASLVSFQETDLTHEASVQSLVRAASERGGPDLLINVAGGFRFGPSVEDLSEADWDSMLQLNLKSTFLCIKSVLPGMKARGYGRIVSVAARSGLKGDAMVAPYAVSKGGVILLTQSVSDEVKDYGITVNAIMPSIVDTAPNREAMADADFNKWVQPSDLAEVVVFLASDRARAVTGAAIPVYNRA